MTAVTTHIPAPRALPTQDAQRPVVDVTRVVTSVVTATAAVLVARQLARRPAPAVARVTMGPGGWVSLKGGAVAVKRARHPFARPRPLPVAVTPAHHDPLWARALSAVPLRRLAG